MAKKKHRKWNEIPAIQPEPAPVVRPRLGDKYSFTPEAFIGEREGVAPGRVPIPRRVTGKVVCINDAHRWFRVAYEVHGYRLSECFKF